MGHTVSSSRWLHQQLVELVMVQELVLKTLQSFVAAFALCTFCTTQMLVCFVLMLRHSIPAFNQQKAYTPSSSSAVGVAVLVLNNTFLECQGIGLF